MPGHVGEPKYCGLLPPKAEKSGGSWGLILRIAECLCVTDGMDSSLGQSRFMDFGSFSADPLGGAYMAGVLSHQ